jgi:hypothetical protein
MTDHYELRVADHYELSFRIRTLSASPETRALRFKPEGLCASGRSAQRQVASAGIMDEGPRKFANSLLAPNVISQRIDAEPGIAKCGSFDSVWPQAGQTSLRMTDRPGSLRMTAVFIL